ncbi:hypothetical protein A6V39_02345 [Candidatus Mycoplasma haematobovis]|uniref:Uncharacterized protein n=1 Tax=Candidatus Mycoplasma haematobovis TaxID=432608 RepID=A0A1A9QE34_9MOLU|nr:hypothetical protein [Candidatus Mycoplasma haematobovis]OAL10261.1 hypothetical protein A6V39_02345 [Candidatus Mycoplasma haematobovis]
MNKEWILINIKQNFLLEKYKTLTNLKKLGIAFSFSNIFTCTVFYLWFILHSNDTYVSAITYLLILQIIIHFYLAFLFLNWSLPYEGAKWIMWAWLTVIFVSPLGIVLLFMCKNPDLWNYPEETLTKETNKSLLHSFGNSCVDLSKNLTSSMEYLLKRFPNETQKLLDDLWNITPEEVTSLDNKSQFLLMALSEALRQNKKKNTFKDIVFNPHWYDHRHFDFALKDPRTEFMVVKHKYLLAFVVLDEFNNYQKILDGKKEIKGNLKFSPAKIICLHWGKGYKVYVNA